MKPEIVQYTEQRIKLIDEEISKCKDEERIKILETIKENILKFQKELKDKKAA